MSLSSLLTLNLTPQNKSQPINGTSSLSALQIAEQAIPMTPTIVNTLASQTIPTPTAATVGSQKQANNLNVLTNASSSKSTISSTATTQQRCPNPNKKTDCAGGTNENSTATPFNGQVTSAGISSATAQSVINNNKQKLQITTQRLQPYMNIIKEASAKYKVPVSYIMATITAESAGNPSAVSPTNAQGLMQVEPFNFKALGISDPSSVTQNIYGGTQLLAENLKATNGVMALASSGYNSGKLTYIPNNGQTPEYVTNVLAFDQYYKQQGYN